MSCMTLSVFVDRNPAAKKIKGFIEAHGNPNAHLAFSVVDVAPLIPVYAYSFHYGGPPYSPEWQEEIRQRGLAVNETVNALQGQLQTAQASGDVIPQFCERSQVEDLVARRADMSDIAVLSRDLIVDRALFDRVFSGIVFTSHVGAMVTHSSHQAVVEPRKVFIAFDASGASIASVHASLAMLERADDVVVGLFDPPISPHEGGEEPGADLAAWLSRRGCRVGVHSFPSGGQEIAKGIQNRAEELGCDLIVMGAYGHSKLRQQMLGGTTSSMLEYSNLPILFGH